MKQSGKTILISSMVLALMVIGCGQRAQNSNEAIQLSKSKPNVEAQIKYLVHQADAFINSDQFNEAIKTAKYVLSNLDSNSAVSQDIIEKAKAELKKIADQKVQEVKGKLGSFGQ